MGGGLGGEVEIKQFGQAVQRKVRTQLLLSREALLPGWGPLTAFACYYLLVWLCVFQPEKSMEESVDLGKDKWRQWLLSAMTTGNPVNAALSFCVSCPLQFF